MGLVLKGLIEEGREMDYMEALVNTHEYYWGQAEGG